MNSKICLVTGSTSGIGRETAFGLSDRGATVILHGRNEERGMETVTEIEKETGNESLDLILEDFSSFENVRELAREIREKYDSLHILINNAGVWLSNRRLTEDGIEMTFAVNHLAHFLLTNLLSDLLIENSPSRIINVSSEAHWEADIDFDGLTGEEGPGGYQAYRQSKLANVLFTYELANRLEGTGVMANCFNPGRTRTRIGRNLGILSPILRWFPLRPSPEKGAETGIYLACSPEVEGVSGKYFVDQEKTKSDPSTYDEYLQKKLWRRSTELVDLRPEETEITSQF